VEKLLNGVYHRFTAPELFAELGSGYRVMVMFDPTDPIDGAEVYNLEEGAKNVKGVRVGDWLGHGEWAEDAPQLGPSCGFAPGVEQRRRYHQGFRAAYASTGLFGRGGMRNNEARDGQGTVRRAEVGGLARPPAVARPTDEEEEVFEGDRVGRKGTATAARGDRTAGVRGKKGVKRPAGRIRARHELAEETAETDV